ncbi:MAG: ATP-dependent Clp protease ATP-binding subunit [Rhodospirillales bacterium]|nr:ATP-dependent Clp protease ATP-binding subunit [Alphaproteobacteria bacterium]MCB9986684.1 ATP-dependent Clp protease ATP-binding subunit [Rhodospirillales bacterium]USO06790.1 MAG: ATP-dependent Clp protease ATP-binding subunit [Rhodospirillales bacterium]
MKIKNKISDEQLEGLIHSYCRDLTALARENRFDPITGRDKEIELVTLILLQKGRKNAMLLAPAGVGKTALVIGLAQNVARGTVPEYLKGARVLEIDLASMSAGTGSISEFQGRFIPLVKGIAERYHDPSQPKYVLFIDEIHTIMPSCDGSAYKGLSEVMKPYLTVGDINIIGATTKDEFRIYVAPDPAMDRRFQKVELAVPDDAATFKILEAIKPGYESHHGITIPSDICQMIVKLTAEHMRKRNQPDKSIIVMDGAAAKHVLDHGRGGALDKESVFWVVSAETGIHKDAFEDKRR